MLLFLIGTQAAINFSDLDDVVLAAKHRLSKIKMSVSSYKDEAALTQIGELRSLLDGWENYIKERGASSGTGSGDEGAPSSKSEPAAVIEFHVNRTKPVHCRFPAEYGSSMRIHYLAKRIPGGHVVGSR